MNPDVARLPVVYDARRFYVATVGLGSDQTWLQCEGADKTFKQDMPLYPSKLSDYISCTKDGVCIYEARYGGGAVTNGVIAEETFTLGSDTGGFESIQLHMGCGLIQQNFERSWGNNHLYGKPDLIAGILGLGSGQWSFLNQLGATGEDAIIGQVGQEVRKTPIVVPELFQTPLYYLNLEDISVGKTKIGFPRGTFELKSQGIGGCVIDSATPISIMYRGHFDKVANLVKAHFNGLGVEYVGKRLSYEVCFRLPGKFNVANFPSLTLHFQKADYVISDYKANFVALDFETVCLGILPKDEDTGPFFLGALQQVNKRILYNVMEQSLSFADEYCELGS
ncbi:aspartic proteinase nepenthesin-2-like [Papaver somniferum]|uniref:aspartic proteinase nepenthesin-2-like n=1 Tax=Papaver somniferum TaxID=3469 RepID=UPI000E6F9FFD|nr:aspartic proteinase nepenthesin-2-like [Papaver somniferum]